jgi:hypothetical protein
MTSEQRLDRLERIAKLMATAGLRARNRVREHDEKIGILLDAQIRTEAAFARLAECQAHTDRRLDALIDIVRGERGGNSLN